METTIAVKESTLQVLVRLKKKLNAASMDEAINKIVQKIEKVPLSRFGSQPRLKSFSQEERGNAHEL